MRLPAEIFIPVAKSFDEDSIGTLASLRSTSRQLYELLDPILYKLAARSIIGSHLAWNVIRNDHVSILQKLLDNGFDVNGLCSTPLMNTPYLPLIRHAVTNRKVEVVKLLLKRGAKASDPNLLIAAQSPIQNHEAAGREICQILLKHGSFSAAALHISLEEAVRSGAHDIVRMHLGAGADVQRRFNDFQIGFQDLTFLHKAAMLGNLEVCKVLIEYGADIELRIPIRHSVQQVAEMWTAGEMFQWYCGDTGPELLPLAPTVTVFDPWPFYELLFPKSSVPELFFADVNTYNPWATE
ncbi:ankyrin repeat-containing domain protein [Pyronema domesticum]|uniref:Similar to Ankyrin repeat and KH domain-containing protein mask acc. no. Q9VCA8 n=1 Tax=Pyronema omphalodes (strain CBS 100304) TaxID=1076935 RepID=U4LJ59_PYROM|nr:ankyrin repeat-containing domain protein [Pyronema domesticum]CCX31602.1 Similar to Ankyrin repeat and KH domain-containing protein mask; acc. no. Q9VCA8 [Pyronema omphalodes CBS 100304]